MSHKLDCDDLIPGDYIQIRIDRIEDSQGYTQDNQIKVDKGSYSIGEVVTVKIIEQRTDCLRTVYTELPDDVTVIDYAGSDLTDQSRNKNSILNGYR